jgi:hypothetical protein
MYCGESRRKVHMGVHLYGIANEKKYIEKKLESRYEAKCGGCKIGYQIVARVPVFIHNFFITDFLLCHIATHEHSLRKKSLRSGCAKSGTTA